MDQDRQQKITKSLEGLLTEGEQLVVDCHEGHIDVQPIEEAKLRPLSEEKPELYGHLLAVSEILSDAGSNFVLVFMMTMAAICLSIHMEWIETILGVDIHKVQSLLVYVVVLTGSFFLSGHIALQIEGSAYRRYRADLIRAIREAGFSRWHLLARISQDEDLSNVVDKLKTDWREWSNSGFDR